MVSKKETHNKKYNPIDIIAYNHTKHKDIEPYDKIGIIRRITAVSLITIGIATTPVPCTTIPLVALGCGMLGYDIAVILPKVIYKARLLCDWAYCNRSPKRLIKTVKLWNMRLWN